MLSIAILALENCIHSTVTGPFDIFTIADIQAKEMSHTGARFCKVDIVSVTREKVYAFNGLPVPVTATITDNRQYDLIVTPALLGDDKTIVENENLITWLRIQHKKGACLCSVCAGAFLIAKAGLFSGKTATTHWGLKDSFSCNYPEINLKTERMLIDEGDVISAGGVTAYLDLCLYLIKKFGSPELAVSISKTLLIDCTRQSQAPYSRHLFTLHHGDENIIRAQKYIDAEHVDPISLQDIAVEAGLTERTLNRRFKSCTGETPMAYLQGVRVESARNLLETTLQSIDEITVAVGYEDTSSFRRLFKSVVGLTPSEYRKKFSGYLNNNL